MKRILSVSLLLLLILEGAGVANNLGMVLRMPKSICVNNDYIYVLDGKGICKYDLKGDFINVINKRIYDINFVEDHISVARYVNNKKAFGTEIMPGDIIDFAKYLQVAPTLEAIIEKIIYPERLKMSSDGNVYALGKDIYRKNYRVGIIDPTDGHTIFIFGKSGTGEADLLWPKDIAVDTEGNIYITNYVYSKEGEKLFAVKKYDNRGNFIKSWGVWGGGNGEFKDPWAIAIDDRNGYVYVTDAFYPSWMRGTGEEHPQERVQKFTKDGKFIKKWGGNRITGVVVFPPRLLVEPDFSDPVGIAVDSKGYVYVLEDDRARVSKFDGDGKLIKRWGKPGVGQGEFRDPQAIAIDKNDNVYIADTGNDRIQKFDPNGKFLMEIR